LLQPFISNLGIKDLKKYETVKSPVFSIRLKHYFHNKLFITLYDNNDIIMEGQNVCTLRLYHWIHDGSYNNVIH